MGPGTFAAKQRITARAATAAVMATCAAALLLASGPAMGKPAAKRAAAKRSKSSALVAPLGPQVTVDYTRGLVLARGASAGDLRSPSPNLARLGAARRAREQATQALSDTVVDLPLASGATVGERIQADPALQANLDAAIARSVEIDIDHATDGSVVLRVGLPLEAVRAALVGPSPLVATEATPGSPAAPTALVVKAGGRIGRPAIGISLVAGGQRYAGPTLFLPNAKAAMSDPRAGDHPMQVAAKSRDGADLMLAGPEAAGTLEQARNSGALVIIVQEHP